jgi:hypothetical protein
MGLPPNKKAPVLAGLTCQTPGLESNPANAGRIRIPIYSYFDNLEHIFRIMSRN